MTFYSYFRQCFGFSVCI